uniref:EGF-like domain-containing protein n=1 Tax=Periophthalmus magnuspinnatus TaxID=409849 RepID=A0A3B3ZEC8_9GOBI
MRHTRWSAGWNTTEGSTANETACDHHSSGDNCTDTDNWNGHFSTCPEKLTHYCIHGECRYIKEMDVVSCRCHPGFVGARCEFIDFSPRREEKKYIILICAVVGLLLVIVVILIVFLQ